MSRSTHYPVESHLTPITAHTFTKTAEWWRGIVRSEDEYGNENVRLYLWRNNDTKGWVAKHKWNVKADHWSEEKAVADQYVDSPVSTDSPYFPVQHYHVVGGETIEKNENWWTEAVQYEDEWSSIHKTRLYMWQLEEGNAKGTGYKWNLSRDTWSEERRLADSLLAASE